MKNLTQAGIDVTFLDTSVDPKEDFYEYAVGGWRKNNEIPADESSWGTFMILRDKNRRQLHNLLCELTERDDIIDGSDFQKLRDFYLEGMDEKKRNEQGIKPLQPKLDMIRAVKNRDELLDLIIHLERIGLSSIWGFGVEQDIKESTRMALYVAQGGLGLPDRDYYTKTDEKSKKICHQYQAHMERMFRLIGIPENTIKENVKDVYNLEDRLARASMTRTEQRNPEKIYNKMLFNELNTEFPFMDWGQYFEQLGNTTANYAIVAQPLFFKEVNEMFHDVPLDNWKMFFIWKVVNQTAGLLSDDLFNESFSFYGKELQGTTEPKARWKRVSTLLDSVLGEILGKLYVEKHFDKESKETINELVDYLTSAYRKRIEGLDWMSDTTKEKACTKLDAIVRKLGYPDEWRDYSKLTIKRDSFLDNCFRAEEFEFEREMNKLGKPVDRKEWFISPATVNAFFHPILNNIVFPAGILQPPFFHKDFDPAVNFGAIGEVIGHEITHGFDDAGSKFDVDGNLNNWWTEEDRKRFDEKTGILEEQFNKCEVFPGEFVNGKMTLGENVADLGGVCIAYEALQQYMKDNGRLPDIDGFTPEQRFFLSFAVFEAENKREEWARQLLIVDVHSPGKLRVNVPLSNMEEFYDAFGVGENNGMYRPPDERVKIW